MQPFCVKDCALVAMATGIKVQTLKEMKDALYKVPLESIYHHFWGGRLKAQFLHPEYHNDFGWWAFFSLQDQVLAERLSVIDPTEFSSLEQLRDFLIEEIDNRIDEIGVVMYLQAHFPFYFIYAKAIVFETNCFIKEPLEFLTLLPTLSSNTIFYHFIEARRRTASSMDDFSTWLKEFKNEKCDKLIKELKNIDIYFLSLTQLREEIFNKIKETWG